MRAGSLMWLLGAGASASAGIPTAWDMIWEFKQQLFISQRRVSPRSVADLASASVRRLIQSHLDASDSLPPAGSPEEYAAIFEAAYPSEADRRAFIDSKIAGAKPSYGHLALAAMMRAGSTKLVWTTNFDPLVADACAKVYDSTGALTTVALDATGIASEMIAAERWPIEIKLHGDFRSRRLKNTGDELRHQDARLRQVLVDCCRRSGLVVAGYSGRDDSVMDSLEAALQQDGAFPAGLFWLHRGGDPPLERVTALLMLAARKGVECAIVSVISFDEVMRDLVRISKNLDATLLDSFGKDRRRWSPAPLPSGGKGWPVLRLNALPIIQAPSVCRRVDCKIGGYREVRAAVDQGGVDVIVARTRVGVLTYGSDSDVRRAFDPFGITEFDLHTIESKRLRYESAERGLLREALARALCRGHGLDVVRRGSAALLAPTDRSHEVWGQLRELVQSIEGTVPGHHALKWREGIALRLEWADDRPWVLIEPRCVFDGITDQNRGAAADFSRERTVRRYNRLLNGLIQFWALLLAGDGKELRALGIADGVDAVFKLSATTAFSRRTPG